MSKSKSWRKHPDGRIEFRGARGILQTVFGVIMTLCGAAFLVGFIGGLFRPGGWAAAVANPGNALGVFLFACFFVVIGWLAAVHRLRIVLDPKTRAVAVVRDMFPFARTRTLRLDEFRAAVLRTSRTASSAKSRSELFYSVILVKADKQSAPVVSMNSVADAGKLGREIAAILGNELIEMSESQWDNFSA